MADRNPTTRGFTRTATLLQSRIRKASESRGFAQSRVLTHWPDIVGEDVAAMSRPVEISYGRGGMGATLVLLTTGAQAPMLEMQKEQIRTRVNSVYGYNAIARIRVTQTAPTGFAEGRVSFEHRQTATAPLTPEISQTARQMAEGVSDGGLRDALERLAANVYAKSTPRE